MSPPVWLPDWKDPKQYPKAKGTTAQRWAWEFLRRNAQYQKMYEEYVRPFYDEGHFDIASAMEYEKKKKRLAIQKAQKGTGPVVTIYGPIELFKREFGIMSPQAPEDASTPFFESQSRRVIVAQSEKSGRNVSILVRPWELYMRFDLEASIPSQILKLKTELETHRARYQKSTPKKSRYIDTNLQAYLRLLDGRASKASTAQMAEVIFPGIKTEPTFERADKRVYQGLLVAKDLRDKGFRQLSRILPS